MCLTNFSGKHRQNSRRLFSVNSLFKINVRNLLGNPFCHYKAQYVLNNPNPRKRVRKMGEEKVILHGMWASPYVKRVELALKIKGIPFDYVDEDLSNKSPLLLQYNPVHKKVPVLVHNGKPICESLIILEYIDETWQNGPQLLPKNPYERAKVRFWAAYVQEMLDKMGKLIDSDKEAQKKALEEIYEKQRILEDGMKELFPGGHPDVNAEKLGILDIMVAVTLGAFEIQEEVLGIKVIDPERNPLLFSWVNALIQLPVVKEVAPPREKVVALFQFLLQRGIKF